LQSYSSSFESGGKEKKKKERIGFEPAGALALQRRKGKGEKEGNLFAEKEYGPHAFPEPIGWKKKKEGRLCASF